MRFILAFLFVDVAADMKVDVAADGDMKDLTCEDSSDASCLNDLNLLQLRSSEVEMHEEGLFTDLKGGKSGKGGKGGKGKGDTVTVEGVSEPTTVHTGGHCTEDSDCLSTHCLDGQCCDHAAGTVTAGEPCHQNAECESEKCVGTYSGVSFCEARPVPTKPEPTTAPEPAGLSGALPACQEWDVKLVDDKQLFIFFDKQWHEACGHWFWDNDYGATTACKKMGYTAGTQKRARWTVEEDSIFIGKCYDGEGLDSCSGKSEWNGCSVAPGNEGRFCGKCAKGQNVGVEITCTGPGTPIYCVP